MENNEKESLKRSHSKVSNAKLTLLCFITIIAFTLLWIGISFIFIDKIPNTLAYIVTGLSGVITILGLIGFNLFKR